MFADKVKHPTLLLGFIILKYPTKIVVDGPNINSLGDRKAVFPNADGTDNDEELKLQELIDTLTMTVDRGIELIWRENTLSDNSEVLIAEGNAFASKVIIRQQFVLKNTFVCKTAAKVIS